MSAEQLKQQLPEHETQVVPTTTSTELGEAAVNLVAQNPTEVTPHKPLIGSRESAEAWVAYMQKSATDGRGPSGQFRGQ